MCQLFSRCPGCKAEDGQTQSLWSGVPVDGSLLISLLATMKLVLETRGLLHSFKTVLFNHFASCGRELYLYGILPFKK